VRKTIAWAIVSLSLACTHREVQTPSYAIYGEYARTENKLAKNGLNRRVFNKVEAQAGSDIALNADGCIALAPGTYRLSGFSMVSMQVTFAPPPITHDNNYPGYCLVYTKDTESAGQSMLSGAIGIGSPSTASDMAPSLFDAIHTFEQKTDVCVGHQAGEDLHDEVYLSVYDVAGMKSEYHAVARIAITKM
jgi:hypothetical protein